MADRRQTKSQVHRRPRHPRRLRGRDRHAPAVHDRHGPHVAGAIGRRGVRRCRRSASRSARCSRSTRSRWQAVGAVDDFADATYVPKVITIVAGIGEVGKTTVYVRKRNPKIDTEPQDQYNQFVAISTRCMHLGLPGALRRGRRALHLPVPRRRLRLPRRGRRRPAGAPARPLLHPRAQRPGRDRPALLGQQRAASASRRATRASRSTASASTSTPRAPRCASSPEPEPQWPSSSSPRRPRA